jgi:hypothetical protein
VRRRRDVESCVGSGRRAYVPILAIGGLGGLVLGGVLHGWGSAA